MSEDDLKRRRVESRGKFFIAKIDGFKEGWLDKDPDLNEFGFITPVSMNEMACVYYDYFRALEEANTSEQDLKLEIESMLVDIFEMLCLVGKHQKCNHDFIHEVLYKRFRDTLKLRISERRKGKQFIRNNFEW